MSILIKNIKEIYTVDEDFRVINNGFMIIENNKIKSIGKHDSEQVDEKRYDKVIDGTDRLALPGFINTHTHSAMTLLRGYADDLPLQEWLEEKIWPFESKLSEADIYWGSLLAIMEMIKSGTTTFNDMYFEMDRVAAAVKETGMRAVLGQGLIEMKDKSKGLNKAVEFAVNWRKQAEGRITTMLAPHAPYTCSPAYLEKIIALSEKHNLPIHIHVAETRNEFDDIKSNYNMTPTALLADVGLLERPVTAAHCVYTTEEDIQLLAARNVGVAYNPMSNMKLGSGIAPVLKMMSNDINVGFGTDGVSSNNNLDLIEEARTGSYLQKVDNLEATALKIKEIVHMLTQTGADILNLNNLGQLKQGFLADIILVDVKNNVSSYPHHNNLSNLFYAGNGQQVETVIVNGEIIMQDKDLLTIDEDKVYKEVEQRAAYLS